MDWKDIVKTIAPTIGTLLGGPLAGTAVKVLGDKLLGDAGASEQQIAETITAGLDPEALAKLRDADNAFKIHMRELDIDVLKLDAGREQAAMDDTKDARRNNAANTHVFWLGLVVLTAFFLVAAAALAGAYYLLFGNVKVSEGVLAATFGLIGAVVGYFAGQAQQVVGFWFGSSLGSSQKTAALADQFGKLGGGNNAGR